MLLACVTADARMTATEAMLAASGVAMENGVRRVAALLRAADRHDRAVGEDHHVLAPAGERHRRRRLPRRGRRGHVDRLRTVGGGARRGFGWYRAPRAGGP